MQTTKPSLVVAACVAHYVAQNADTNTRVRTPTQPYDMFTATDIVARYQLEAGEYEYESGRHIPRAEQLVRNELAARYKCGDIVRIHMGLGRALKRGRQWWYAAAGGIPADMTVPWQP